MPKSDRRPVEAQNFPPAIPTRNSDRIWKLRSVQSPASTRTLRSAVAERPVVQRGKRDDRGHQPDKD